MMNHAPPSPSRPRSVTFALLGVFLLGVWNFGRAVALYQQMDLLQELSTRPGPQLRLVMALVFGGVFMVLWWLLRQKRPFTRKLIPLVLSIYALYELGLVVIFGQSPLTPQAVWLNAGFYALLILGITWALNRKTAVAGYFRQTTAQTETPK